MKPPVHLKAPGRRYWRGVMAVHELTLLQLPLLTAACEALDAIEWAKGELDREGRVYTAPTGTLKPHPALAIKERAERSVATALRELGVSVKARRTPTNRRSTPADLRPVVADEDDPRSVLNAS
jgi:P27 family predicted phage terminase small subunit